MNAESDLSLAPDKENSWIDNAKSLEWIGQTVASICWICSVFVIGVSSSGDWLQLIAGVAWLVANIASLNKK